MTDTQTGALKRGGRWFVPFSKREDTVSDDDNQKRATVRLMSKREALPPLSLVQPVDQGWGRSSDYAHYVVGGSRLGVFSDGHWPGKSAWMDPLRRDRHSANYALSTACVPSLPTISGGALA